MFAVTGTELAQHAGKDDVERKSINNWRQRSSRQARLVALVLALPTGIEAATEKRPIKASVVTKLCAFSSKAKASAASLAASIKQGKDAVISAKRAYLQHSLAALKVPSLKLSAETFKLYATQNLDAATSSLANWEDDNTKMLGQAMYASGRIDELMHLLQNHQQESPSAQNGCIGGDSNGNAARKIVDTKCGTADTTTLTTVITDLATEIKTTLQDTGNPEKTGAAAPKCRISENPNTAYSSVTQPIHLLNGLIQVAAAGGFQNTPSIHTAAATNNLLKALSEKDTKLATKMQQTVAKTPTDEVTVKALLKDKTTRAALGAAAQKVRTWKAGSGSADADELVKSFFEVNADNEEGGYLTAIKAINAEVPTQGNTKQTKTLFQMNDDQLQYAIAEVIENINAMKTNKTACPKTTGAKTQSNQQAAELCAEHNRNQKLCPKDKCNYDEKENKCKPKEGKEQTNAAGAGEGANTEAKKCSDKKKEEDCKDGCKWDGKECKESSILAKKIRPDGFCICGLAFLKLPPSTFLKDFLLLENFLIYFNT